MGYSLNPVHLTTAFHLDLDFELLSVNPEPFQAS